MDEARVFDVDQVKLWLLQALDIAKDWLTSPAAWTQFGLLVVAWGAAVFVNRKFVPKLVQILSPAEDAKGPIAKARRFIIGFVPLILPLFAYALTGAGEGVTRSLFGSGAVIAFGKRVFLFLAVRALVRDMIKDTFLRLLGRYVLVPVAGIYALGLLPFVMGWLESTVVPLGNLSFDLLWLVKFVIVSGVIFWVGRWSNDQSQTFLKTQAEMPVATRQLAIKAAEVAIFGAAFLILMNIMGINLTSLAVIGGAIGVGVGFGLQQIASNFISGIILLLEGQATVGDFVELDGGEAGTIVKMTMRSTILETFDGKWIVVPNEHFITTRVINYSDQGSANRLEAPFSVSYDTDINRVPALIEAAVAAHPGVLSDPTPPDCELRGFGDSGIDFCVEFWVNGIDDGKNKYVSDVLFVIWNTLKAEGIEIPYPHRVVEIKGQLPQ